MLLRTSLGQGASVEVTRRLRWAYIVGAVVFLGLAVRLWMLQVVHGDSYYRRTVSNVVHERYLPSVRGMIVDRNGVALAENRPAFNIYVTPSKFTPAQRDALAALLGLSEEDVAKVEQRAAAGRKRNGFHPVLILEDQGRDRAALVEQSRYRLDGVEVRHEPYRTYPRGDTAAHVIGYMTQMTEAEIDRLGPEGDSQDDLVGRYGLEAEWENYLRGKKGVERYALDARGRRLDDATAQGLISGERVIEPVAGAKLVLTLDAELQKVAEKAAARHPAVAVAVVDVKTGRILALVSRPSFDPNVMTGHLTRAEETLMLSDPRHPFIDKALRAQYPPGSIFKFVTAIAALADGLGAHDESMVCNGSYELAHTTFKCTSAHGKLDLIGAIKHSCNVYFWRLAERVGLDRLAAVAREYGFGAPTQLGLNGEGAGRIPTRAWYEERSRYKVGYATNAATGQGDVEVTVLQVAMAYAALANGGTLHVPQVVERVESAQGQTLVNYAPKVARQISTTPDVLDVLRRGMVQVVGEAGGTAFETVRSEVVSIAGKTGTAEVKKRRSKDEVEREIVGWHPEQSHAWFAGWAPVEAPEVAIAVLVEHGGSGGKVAGPVARAILESYWTTSRRRIAGASSGSAP
jgi:penicillin-binding protein 2